MFGNYIGYELYEKYKEVIDEKINLAGRNKKK